jgi:hypothetical protein
MSHGQVQTHKTHHVPDLGEATTFSFIVYFVHAHKTSTQNVILSRDSQVGLSKFLKLGLPRLWGPHNFAYRLPIEMISKEKL